MKILEEKRDFEFMTERVKERPLNKRKLLRKTIITVTMAVIFGLIACVTFLVLEPVFQLFVVLSLQTKVLNSG